MDEYMLIDMMFDNEPIEKFEELLKSYVIGPEWGELLHLCYCIYLPFHQPFADMYSVDLYYFVH